MNRVSRTSALDQHHFLLRRLHSLSGLVPIGLFMIAHLTTNSTLVWGAANGRVDIYLDDPPSGRAVATFWEEVQFINGLPFLLLIEIALWLSIAFHSVLGVYYATTGKGNTSRYPYQDNWRYTLQRISGYVGLVYIFYHVATLRWGWDFLVPGGISWTHHFTGATLAAALRGSWGGITPGGLAVALLYAVGVTSLVFHFANGLWTMAISWGITITAAAQRRWGYVCAVLGIGLMGAGWAGLIGAYGLDPVETAKIEHRLVHEKHGEELADRMVIEMFGADLEPVPDEARALVREVLGEPHADRAIEQYHARPEETASGESGQSPIGAAG